MRSLVKPRKPAFSRHCNLGSSKTGFLSRRKRVLKAICPSIRAKGAPKQKCAALPNAKCRLSERSKSRRSGSGNRWGRAGGSESRSL
jgi:hypothetical protein